MKLPNYLIIGILLMFFTLNSTTAQTFEAGAGVGFNMSQIDGDDLFGFRRIGLSAGPILNINTGTKWQFCTGILYSQLGSARGRFDGLSDYDNIRVNFVEVPLVMRFKDWLGKDDKGEYYRLGFEAGLTYGRLINFRAIELQGGDITDDKDYNPTALNINFGATYFINHRLGVHAHWAKQLNDLDNDEFEVLVSRYINVMLYYYL